MSRTNVLSCTEPRWWLIPPEPAIGLTCHLGSVQGDTFVKAFNTLAASVVTAHDPRRAGGRLIAFLAGDDADAKATVSAFADSLVRARRPRRTARRTPYAGRRRSVVRFMSSRSHSRNLPAEGLRP